jgi:hypothetical protein
MLTNDSPMFRHQDHVFAIDTYYEVIQVNVFVEDTYSFTSKSSFNTYGYIYKYSFDPANLKWNLIWKNDNGGRNEQFELIVSLRPDITYFLIVTTSSNVMSVGEFSIVASGPALVNFNRTVVIPKGKT